MFSLLALVLCALVVVSAPAAQAAEPASRGSSRSTASRTRKWLEPKNAPRKTAPFTEPNQELTPTEAEAEGYTQAAGHIPFGVTDFTVDTTGIRQRGSIPTAVVTHVRIDVAPGLATNPTRSTVHNRPNFGGTKNRKAQVLRGARKCAGTRSIGRTNVDRVRRAKATCRSQAPSTTSNSPNRRMLAHPSSVSRSNSRSPSQAPYSRKPSPKKEPAGEPTEKALAEKQYFAHTLIEGNVEWGKEAKAPTRATTTTTSKSTSRRRCRWSARGYVFNGRSGNGAFITNATNCPGTPHHDARSCTRMQRRKLRAASQEPTRP